MPPFLVWVLLLLFSNNLKSFNDIDLENSFTRKRLERLQKDLAEETTAQLVQEGIINPNVVPDVAGIARILDALGGEEEWEDAIQAR